MLDTKLFVERDRCISCNSNQCVTLSSGRFGDQPLRSFIEADPTDADPMEVLENERWELRQCTSCGQKQHAFVPSAHLDELCYSVWSGAEAISAFEAEQGMINPASEHVQHLLRLQDLGVRRLLDFGCGYAKFLQMCRLFNIEALGVDKSQGRRTGAGIDIFADLADVEGDFDAVTLFEVLEHLYEPMPLLLQLKSRLRPGGVMIVEVPDTTGINTIDSLESYRAIHPLAHVNAFTSETLVAFMARAGFKPINKKAAFCTTSLMRVAKDVAKARIRRWETQLYFTQS